jgi:hypothetical protein
MAPRVSLFDRLSLLELAPWVGIGALAIAGFELVRLSLSRWWSIRVRRAQQSRAQRGEREAETLLADAGFRVIGRQVPATMMLVVDGRPLETVVRADLLAMRGGQRYVAEVKTGRVAPRIESASTRRQLLEYRLAYDVDGVLLVDAELGTVREITFPLLALAPRRGAPTLALLAIGLAGLAVWVSYAALRP